MVDIFCKNIFTKLGVKKNEVLQEADELVEKKKDPCNKNKATESMVAIFVIIKRNTKKI